MENSVVPLGKVYVFDVYPLKIFSHTAKSSEKTETTGYELLFVNLIYALKIYTSVSEKNCYSIKYARLT